MSLRPLVPVLIGLTTAVTAAVLPALPAAAIPSTSVVVNELHTNNQAGQPGRSAADRRPARQAP